MGNFQSSKHDERGAIFVELAITLPVILALLFFIYWAYLAIGWRDSISVAVYNAVDLAIGRGDPVLIGIASTGELESNSAVGLIAGIDNYVNGTSSFSTAANLGSNGVAGILNSGHAGINPEQEYNESISRQGWSGSPVLSDFPRQALYAMAFAYQMLEDALPGDTRYPCDPAGTTPPDGPGCLICTVGTPAQTMLPANAGVPTDRFAIECQYKPSGELLGALQGLLGMSSGNSLVISHSRNSMVEDSEFLLNP